MLFSPDKKVWADVNTAELVKILAFHCRRCTFTAKLFRSDEQIGKIAQDFPVFGPALREKINLFSP